MESPIKYYRVPCLSENAAGSITEIPGPRVQPDVRVGDFWDVLIISISNSEIYRVKVLRINPHTVHLHHKSRLNPRHLKEHVVFVGRVDDPQ